MKAEREGETSQQRLDLKLEVQALSKNVTLNQGPSLRPEFLLVALRMVGCGH